MQSEYFKQWQLKFKLPVTTLPPAASLLVFIFT